MWGVFERLNETVFFLIFIDLPKTQQNRLGMSASSDSHEDFCHVCKAPGDLLCCDSCSLVFHMTCLDLKVVPESAWHCPRCVGQMRSRKRSLSETEVEKESIEEYVKKARVSLKVMKEKGQIYTNRKRSSSDVDFSKIEEVTPKIARKIVQNGLSIRPLRKIEFDKLITYLKHAKGIPIKDMRKIQKCIQSTREELFSKMDAWFPTTSSTTTTTTTSTI